MFIEQLPVPIISPEEQAPFVKEVDNVLEAKKSGCPSVSNEDHIDGLVYSLYGLSDKEIEYVDHSSCD